jgi:hypothetical protein
VSLDDTELKKLIATGISHLAEEQQSNGSFLGLSTSSRFNASSTTSYQSVFFTSLILSCLEKISPYIEVEGIKKDAAAFLVGQKSKYWSFNYWVKDSREAKIYPYPDDLDDTFCALSALYSYKTDLVDAKAMASIVKLLTITEMDEGGPYRTWLVSESSDKQWSDVDVAVNSNVAYFLSIQDVLLPNVQSFIEQSIEEEDFISPYYPHIYPIFYFISRFYKGKFVQKLQKSILAKRVSSGWGNPLSTALATSALLNLGASPYSLQRSIESIIQEGTGGMWKPYPFCFDPTRAGKIFFSGSSALTNAFCLEALTKYLLTSRKKEYRESAPFDNKEVLCKEVFQRVESRLSRVGNNFYEKSSSTLSKILSKDKNNYIPLLPYYFATMLDDAIVSEKKELIVQLGVANVYGWLAYTIYDDFWDEEGDPKNLATANICLRELTHVFLTILPRNEGFVKLFSKVLDGIDFSNDWEVNYCRIPCSGNVLHLEDFTSPDFGDYSQLSKKSFGHALGPLALLFSIGYTNHSFELGKISDFFHHYLIAKQLNDDAHDVIRDLQNGHCSAVVGLLIKDYQKKSRFSSTQVLNLQEVFWESTIDTVGELIMEHIRLARASLSIPIVKDASVLLKILRPLESSVLRALKERDNARNFLAAYELFI